MECPNARARGDSRDDFDGRMRSATEARTPRIGMTGWRCQRGPCNSRHYRSRSNYLSGTVYDASRWRVAEQRSILGTEPGMLPELFATPPPHDSGVKALEPTGVLSWIDWPGFFPPAPPLSS